MKRVPGLILIFVGFAWALDCTADSAYHIDYRTLLLDGVTPNPYFNQTIATGLCACLGFETTLSGMPEDSTVTLVVKMVDNEPIRGVQLNVYHDAGSTLVFGDLGSAHKGKKLEDVYNNNGQALATDAMEILSNEVDDHVKVIAYSANRAQTAGDGEEDVLFTLTYKAPNGHEGLPASITFYLEEVKIPGTSSAPDLLNVSCDYPGVDNAVTFNTSEMGIEDEAFPTVFSLSQNYPNPFNPTTRIAFDLPQQSMVNMIIYNVLGQQVKIIENNSMKAGHHILDWNGLDMSGNEVASGIYFYELRTENFIARKKMLLIR